MNFCRLRILKSPIGLYRRGARMCSLLSVEELKIPVPFGHMSAKAWGPSDGQPVLALHGWQDNAGTFDLLVPHLDPSLRIVSLDLPGHGLSSHMPPGCIYHFLENLLYIKMAVDHLKWTRCSMLGHSMGGGLSLLFASLFTDTVDAVVSLDIFKPLACSHDDQIWETRRAVEKAVETFRKLEHSAPVYSPEEALNRMVRGSFESLTPVSADVLLKRGSAPSADGRGVTFTRDIRLQIASIQKLDDKSCQNFLSGVQCNLLIVKAIPGFHYESVETVRAYHDMYARNCKRFFYKEVEGNHHVHIDNPEPVASVINLFLLKLYSKL